MATSEYPDIGMTPDEIVAQFLTAKDSWDDTRFDEDACDEGEDK